MKKLVLILVFLLSSCIYTQTIKIGVSGNFLEGNKYYNYQFGPSFSAEYSFEHIPLTITPAIRLYVSELNDAFLPGYNNNVFGIEASLNYYPINWEIEPYLGAGVYYYSNSMKPGGMISIINGNIQHVENSNNNFSVEITGGIKFSAKSPINFIMEVTKTYSKKANLITSDFYDGSIISEKEINIFNSLFIRLGLLFNI